MKKGVIPVLSALMGAALGAGAIGKMTFGEKEKIKAKSDKHEALFLMMNQWVKLKQEGKNVTEYFKKNGYHRIAVYGMSHAGQRLIDELKDTEIEVAYGIDKNVEAIYADIVLQTMEEEFEEVDAIVVTAITFYYEIEEELSKKVNCPILSLEDIIFEV